MAMIKKKLWSEYYDAVASGRKKYELRLADFDIAEGDTLILQEWDKEKREYTGRELRRRVTYVGKFKWEDLGKMNPQEEWNRYGLQIISME